MSHEIGQTNGQSDVAYVGDTPWHGLGQKLNGDESLDQWRIAAGLNWQVDAHDTFTKVEGSEILIPGKKTLVRSDNQKIFEVVSDRYKIVQPEEITAFYDDLIRDQGFKMHTAGALKGGCVIWALAEIGEEFTLPGKDRVENFMLLTTSFDKKSATRAQFTSVRVVCNNTLRYSLATGQDFVSIVHNKKFDADEVKEQLDLRHDGWSQFKDGAIELVKFKMDDQSAIDFFINVLGDPEMGLDDQVNRRSIINVFDLYRGQGKGATLKSSANTLWGALNAVTELQDWHKGRAADTRMTSAWLGQGSQLKKNAFNHAMDLIAA